MSTGMKGLNDEAGKRGFIWKAAGCRGWSEWPPLCKSSRSAPCTSSPQLAASASLSGLWGKWVALLKLFFFFKKGYDNQRSSAQAVFPLHSPSSPPVMEKSRSRMLHFWMRWALEVATLFTALIPSWMALWTARSFPPAISETRVALLPTFRQNSIASGVSSSSGSPDSAFTLHYGGGKKF